MPASLFTLALVAAAALADGAGAHHLAFYLVLLAIPTAATAAFSAAADLVAGKRSLLSSLTPACVLFLLVLGSAARANAAQGTPVPRLAITAVLTCLVLYGVQAVRLLRPLPVLLPRRSRVAETRAEAA